MADRRKILIPIAVLLAGIIATVALVASRPEVEKAPQEITPPNVRVLEVYPQDIRVTVNSQGSVVPKTQSSLVSEVSGRIKRVAADFETGGFVRRGQHLVFIDQRDYQVNLASQQAALAQAKVMLERENAEAQVARNEWDALGKGGTPNPLVLREPQLQEARARVDAAEAAVERAELDLERTIIRAPFSGRIRSKAVDVGGFVNRGSPIATLYSVDVAEVRLPIPDAELAFLGGDVGVLNGNGPDVELRAQFAGEQRTWTGRIVRTEGEIDPQTRMVNLVAAVNDPYGLDEPVEAPLGVGLFVEAGIKGTSIDGAFRLPRSAVRHDGRVTVVAEDRLSIRPVHVVRSEADHVIVTQGLQPGDQVVVSKLDVATEGMRVTPLPAVEDSLFTQDDVAAGIGELDLGAASDDGLDQGELESNGSAARSEETGGDDEGAPEDEGQRQ